MITDFFTAQIFGCLAMIISIASWQIKDPKLIILCNFPACLFWGMQYVYLGATIGIITCFSTAIKDGVLYVTNEKQSKQIISLFFVTTLLLLLWNFKNWVDLLPISSLVIYNAALYFYRDNRSILSRATVLTKICWFIYCLNAGAYAGMTCSLLVLCSSLIGMVRYEQWKIGMCYKTMMPSLARYLFITQSVKT